MQTILEYFHQGCQLTFLDYDDYNYSIIVRNKEAQIDTIMLDAWGEDVYCFQVFDNVLEIYTIEQSYSHILSINRE